MTSSVYGVDDALSTVRVPTPVVDGSTSGNSATNREPTASPIVRNVAVNAQPSRRVRTSSAAATRHSAASTATTAEAVLPVRTWVHSRKPAASTTVIGAS